MLGPAIHETAIDSSHELLLKMTAGWVYFMTNRANGILYVGVADHLARRAWREREDVVVRFTVRSVS